MSPFDASSDASDWQERTQRALSPLDPLLQFAEGAMLGSFCIERFLAKGGMGILYVARHERGGQRVALKVLNPQFNQQPDILKRFADEARAVNKIKHDHIVEIYDFIQQPNGLNYLVMELLEGRDLWRTHQADGPFALARALSIAKTTASALQAAHASQIIHRDLKPENVFLAKHGDNPEFVKLLDFGIAKLIETTGRQTMTGLVMGTPEFMAPEQGLGARVDERADVYAFGVVLYWMLTGRLPFRGDQLVSFEVRRQGPPPMGPLSESGEPIPEQLEQLVRGCLAFDREQRIASMFQVINGLEGRRSTIDERPAVQPGFDETEVIATANPTPTPSMPRRARPLALAALVGALVLAGSAGWWLTRPKPNVPPHAEAEVVTPVLYPTLMLQEPARDFPQPLRKPSLVPEPAKAPPVLGPVKSSPVLEPAKPSAVRQPSRPVHHRPRLKPQSEPAPETNSDLLPIE